MGKRSRKTQSYKENTYYPFILILPLLLIPVFFRGLFFDKELLIAHMYTALVLAAYIYYKRDSYFRISLNLMDMSFLGLALAFLLSSFVAFNLRDAIGEFYKVINYFLVFLLLSRLAVDEVKMRIAMLIMFLSGVGVALIGIGAAFGTFDYNGAFVQGMINSTLQYHNAAAIYMFACGTLGLYLASSLSDKKWVRYLVTGGNYLILITAMGAGSRGAMLVAPVAFVLFFIGIPQGYRRDSFKSLIAIMVPFVVLSKATLNFNSSVNNWMCLFVGIAVAFFIHFGLDYLLSKVKISINTRYLWMGSTIAFLIALVAVVGFSDTIMPESISQRIQSIDIEQETVVERFYFYEDAMKVVKDYPVLGTGGGGWNSIYRHYQSYLYHTTEVHNHPLQIWVEGGTIGFVFFILLWVGALTTVLKLMFRKDIDSGYKAVIWSTFSTAVALGMHSFIDFSLSLGAVSILLWSQFGLIRANHIRVQKGEKVVTDLKPIVRSVLGYVVAILFFISSLSLYLGESYAFEGQKAMGNQNLMVAAEKLESAIKFDPINSRFRLLLAQVYAYQGAQKYSRALVEAKKAIELNEGSSDNYWVVSKVSSALGNINQTIEYAERAVELSPMVPESYENLAVTYLYAGKAYLQLKQPGKAKEVLNKILLLPDKMDKIQNSLNGRRLEFWKGPTMAPSDKYKEVEKEAKELLSQL